MQDEVTAIKCVVVKLLPAFIRTGSITDEELLQALCGSNAAQRALWVDREPDGKAAGNRNFGINAEGRQRANELSAVVQCDLRVAAAQAAVAKKAADAEAEAVHVRQILAANADAEAALAALGVAPKEAKPPHFTKLTRDQLRAFIHVRVFKRSTLRGAKFKVSTAKGNLADAQKPLAQGEEMKITDPEELAQLCNANLIAQAFIVNRRSILLTE